MPPSVEAMSSEIVFLSPALRAYVEGHASRPNRVQRDLIAATAALGPVRRMQVGVAQGAFMTMLTTLLRPRFAVELGTFTGYSALAVAKALPPGGRLLCCDVSEEWTAMARGFWERAGVAERIDLRIGPALRTLRGLPEEPLVDFAFIDADKGGYVNYYEELVPRLSSRGVILADNALWDGLVADPSNRDDTTEALRAFNARAAADPRVMTALLPVGDGLMMIAPRPAGA